MAALINLLPWRARRRQRRLKLWGGGTLLAALLVITLAFGWQRQLVRKVHLLQAQVSSLTMQQQALRERLLRAQSQQETHQRLLEKRRADAALKAAVSRWEAVLNTLATRLPEGSWLSHVSWQNNKATLQGSAGNARELTALEGILRALPGAFWVQSGGFHEEAGKGFSFTFTLTPGGG